MTNLGQLRVRHRRKLRTDNLAPAIQIHGALNNRLGTRTFFGNITGIQFAALVGRPVQER